MRKRSLIALYYKKKNVAKLSELKTQVNIMKINTKTFKLYLRYIQQKCTVSSQLKAAAVDGRD